LVSYPPPCFSTLAPPPHLFPRSNPPTLPRLPLGSFLLFFFSYQVPASSLPLRFIQPLEVRALRRMVFFSSPSQVLNLYAELAHPFAPPRLFYRIQPRPFRSRQRRGLLSLPVRLLFPAIIVFISHPAIPLVGMKSPFPHNFPFSHPLGIIEARFSPPLRLLNSPASDVRLTILGFPPFLFFHFIYVVGVHEWGFLVLWISFLSIP